MFVLRTIFIFVIASMFANTAEAQLFRFRQNSNYEALQNSQRYGYQSAYNARNYQYTQVQPRASYVPSQRFATQTQTIPQTTACHCAQQQQFTQQLPNQTRPVRVPIQQNKLVVVTYRDPSTGRLFQRQHLVQQPIAQQPAVQPSIAASQQSEALSVANPIATTTQQLPQLDPPSGNNTVATTSFNVPVLEEPAGTSDEFSILNTEADVNMSDKSTSVLETAIPTLEAPVDSSEAPGSLIDAESNLDLDLPPLTLEDSK